MTYPRSHGCQVTELEVRLSLSSSKVPAFVSHTNLPLSGHERSKDMQVTPPPPVPPVLLWFCLLSALCLRSG